MKIARCPHCGTDFTPSWTTRPHELQALRAMIACARSIAQVLPDKSGDTFAGRMLANAQIIEDMLERIE